MRRLIALIGCGLLIASPSCAGPKTISAAAACKLLAERGKHVGETITFYGDYTSDHIERTVIRPAGCPWGIGLGSIDPKTDRLIDRLDQPLGGKGVRGEFTGTLVQSERNDFEFFKDDGIRLNVIRLDHPVVFVWKPKL